MAASADFILRRSKRLSAHLEAVNQTAYILLNNSKQAG
jgi:hypothetical protein